MAIFFKLARSLGKRNKEWRNVETSSDNCPSLVKTGANCQNGKHCDYLNINMYIFVKKIIHK